MAAYVVCILSIPILARYARPVPINSKYLIWGQLAVPCAVLGVALLFNSQGVMKTTAENLAGWSLLKMPADRVVLALSENGEAYSALRTELTKPVWFRELYLDKWTAVFHSVYAALIWFGVMLPVVFTNYLHKPDDAAPFVSSNSFGRSGFIISFLAILALLSTGFNNDWLFVPIRRWALIGPLISSHVPLVVMLNMVPSLAVNKNYLNIWNC